ncbi:MAG: hypothetical protein ABLT11_07250 [Candidatus Acidiferrum sp.]
MSTFRWWILIIPAVLSAMMYGRFFGGFWLGDDFPNLQRMWMASARGELWSETWTQFFVVAPAQGSFYRPAMIASLALNEYLAGSRFAGWFAFNFVVHVLNSALVGMLAARFAAVCERDGRLSGAIAAAFFALCPAIPEGVFWISARADESVTLLTLTGAYIWAAAPATTIRAMALPLFLVPALGFKESAAVFPLQMALVALAYPARLSRAQIAALASCFVLLGLFFGIRTHFFGQAWQVYGTDYTEPALDRLWHGAFSLGDWWIALTKQTPLAALVYVVSSAAALLLFAAGANGAHKRLATALFCASLGFIVASMLNLGSMSASGEQGRLFYTPIAWLALAFGVAGARPGDVLDPHEKSARYRLAGIWLLACATAIGAWVIEPELRLALIAQRNVRQLADAARAWAESHAGITLLIVEELFGPVVTMRNAQGGLVMPPVQPRSLLHRVLPTLPTEIELRYEQLSTGLATRLEKIRPSGADAEELRQIFDRDGARWPDHYACWSNRESTIIELAPLDSGNRALWIAMLRDNVKVCAIQGQQQPRRFTLE